MTARSRSLWPMLTSIWQWERRWVPDHAQRLPGMRHLLCDAGFNPLLTCKACGQATSEKDVAAQWGPSGSWERSIPSTRNRRRSDNHRGAAGSLFPQTMSVMGDRWGFALLVAAFVGVGRFTDFQAQLGASPGTIADRLSVFAAEGILISTDSRYRLTEKGAGLLPGARHRTALGATVVSRRRGRCGGADPQRCAAARSARFSSATGARPRCAVRKCCRCSGEAAKLLRDSISRRFPAAVPRRNSRTIKLALPCREC